MVANLCGLVLLLIGCLLILANGMAAFKNLRNRRRGLDKHLSYITVVPQLVMALSALCLHAAAGPWFPFWLPFLVSASDPSLWVMLYHTVLLVLDRPRARQK